MSDKKEDFGTEDVQDTCHYVCSSVNWVNTFLFLLIMILIYYYFNQKQPIN